MSRDQQNINIQIDVSSNPSESQQTEGSSDGKMMTQAEYLKYKQGDSNANNYYGHSRVVDSKPVSWVKAVNYSKFLFCDFQENFLIINLGWSICSTRSK